MQISLLYEGISLLWVKDLIFKMGTYRTINIIKSNLDYLKD